MLGREGRKQMDKVKERQKEGKKENRWVRLKRNKRKRRKIKGNGRKVESYMDMRVKEWREKEDK